MPIGFLHFCFIYSPIILYRLHGQNEVEHPNRLQEPSGPHEAHRYQPSSRGNRHQICRSAKKVQKYVSEIQRKIGDGNGLIISQIKWHSRDFDFLYKLIRNDSELISLKTEPYRNLKF